MVLDLKHAPLDVDSYVYIYEVVREMRTLIPRLDDLTICRTDKYEAAFFPSSIIPLCSGIPNLTIQADMKGEVVA